MDDFKKLAYKANQKYLKLDAGNLTAQIALRERLQCKPFEWFLENVAYELYIVLKDYQEKQDKLKKSQLNAEN